MSNRIITQRQSGRTADFFQAREMGQLSRSKLTYREQLEQVKTLSRCASDVALARQIFKLRDQEAALNDYGRHEYLGDLGNDLLMIADDPTGCECAPDGPACYYCRKTGEAKRVLEGDR